MASLAPPPSSFVFTVFVPPPPPASSSSGTSDTIIGVIVIVVVIVLAAMSVGLCCYLWGRKKRRQAALALQGHVGDSADLPLRHWQQQPLPVAKPVAASFTGSNVSSTRNGERPRRSPGNSLDPSNSIFTYEELEAATDGFSDANLMGQGGFGYVHKGVLSNGVEVAIKQLKSESWQGEREFQAEVEIISRIHHRNLLVLLGYCISGSARMLVYEFIPNNTMEFHLHADSFTTQTIRKRDFRQTLAASRKGNGRPVLSWATRVRMAVGSARGLAYLHEDCRPKIIHRDIKAANILLNNRFEAKVADFGLAKFTSDAETHVSTRVMGTFGYLAPEYAASGRLTAKSDVYSFGVILLELLTGRIPFHLVEDKTMVNWAKPLLAQALEDGNFDRIADPRLQNNYNSDEMARMVACAASCVRESARHRPRMSLIVRALEGSIPSNELNEPGVYTAFYSYGSSDSDSQDNEDMYSQRQNMASDSQGHTTGEHSLFTGSSSELQQHTKNQADSVTDQLLAKGEHDGSGLGNKEKWLKDK